MNRESILRVAAVVSLPAVGIVGPGFAQGSFPQTDDSASENSADQAGDAQEAEAKLAEKASNPLSDMWAFSMPNDTWSYDGDALSSSRLPHQGGP